MCCKWRGLHSEAKSRRATVNTRTAKKKKEREREGRSRVGLIEEVMFRPGWRSQGKEP